MADRMSDSLRTAPRPINREAVARAMRPMSQNNRMGFDERLDAMIREGNFNGMQLTGNVRQGAPDWRSDLQEKVSEQLELGRAGRGRLNKVMNVGEVVSGVGGFGAGIADTAQASSPMERNLMGALTALSIIPGMGAVTKYAKPALKNALYRSRLGPAIEAMPMDKMTGQQAASHFSKFPGGVGSDELNYTGVQGLLTQPQVTKAGLLEQYRANPLEINDVIKGGDETKFGPGRGYNTTLPGGDDYQELLMTLPTPSWYYAGRKDAPSAEAASKIFTSDHYDEPNILAHARYNTRNVDGDKTLFIEEIQSDWHQTGRNQGYKGDIDYDTLRAKQQKVFEEKSAIGTDVTAQGYDATQAQQSRYMALDNEYKAIQKQLDGNANAVPDAPYKSTDKWQGLAFSRMVRQAADGGHDRIAWTPGQVQADRYDLSKKMKSVEVIDEGNGTFELMGVDKDGQGFGIATKVKAEDIQNHIGKDAADKALAQFDGLTGDNVDHYALSREWDKLMKKKRTKRGLTKAERSRLDNIESAQNGPEDAAFPLMASLSGLDLQVGGEGMKSFYDKMMVKTANKFAKKYGQKVEVKSMEKIGVNAPNEVWSLKLTPEMKKDILKGGVALSGAGVAATSLMGQDGEYY